MPHSEFDYEQVVSRVWRETVAATSVEGIQSREAKEAAAMTLARMVEADELKIPYLDAIYAALDRAEDADGKSADRIIKHWNSGQSGFDLEGDPGLDLVVKVGRGMRKTWRNINADDLRQMDVNRYENARNAANAYDDWRNFYNAAVAAVIEAETFGAAVDGGLFGGTA